MLRSPCVRALMTINFIGADRVRADRAAIRAAAAGTNTCGAHLNQC
jgi:hypothetical protein